MDLQVSCPHHAQERRPGDRDEGHHHRHRIARQTQKGHGADLSERHRPTGFDRQAPGVEAAQGLHGGFHVVFFSHRDSA